MESEKAELIEVGMRRVVVRGWGAGSRGRCQSENNTNMHL